MPGTPEEQAAAQAASEKAAADAATKAASEQATKDATEKAAAEAATAANAAAAKAAADEAAKGLEVLKLSEGSLVKPERLTAIKAFAKEKNLSVDQATVLLNNEETALKDYSAAQKAQYDSTVEAWATASKADPRFGGEKLAGNLEAGRRVVNKYGSEKFRALVKETGYENHPEFLDFILNIAKASKEDNFFQAPQPPRGTPKTRAEALYPNGGKAAAKS